MTNHGRRMTDKSPEQKETDLAKALDEWKAFTIKKFDEGAERMVKIEASVKENTDLTAAQSVTIGATKDSVKEVLDIVTALKGGKTVLGWGGRLFMWLGGLAGAWAAISAALHGEVRLPWQ